MEKTRHATLTRKNQGKKGKVLAVDDEPLILNLVALQAKKLSYAIETASSGPEALGILQKESFDILLTDILMPGMDGLTLMREAKKLQPDIECIVASGQHEIRIAVEAMRQGAVNYLPKPVTIQELDVALAKGMEKRRLIQQLRKNQGLLEEAARDLAQETAKSKMILDAAGEGIVGLDQKSKIIFINPAALSTLEQTHEESIGKTFHTLTRCTSGGGDPYRPDDCPVCKAIKEGEEFQTADVRFHRKDGTSFFAELICTPTAGDDSETMGAVLLFTDITGQKKVQEELARYRGHLEKLVAERTAELAKINIRLQADIKARKKAEKEAERRRQQLIEADKMASLGVLIAGVAHEINNPNNFITMNTPILKQAWKDFQPILERFHAENGDFTVAGIPYSEMRHHVPELFSGILDGSDRIKKIVLNLRDYARQGVSDMNQTFDVNEVLKAALTLLANPLKRATNHLTVTCGENLPRITGNFQRAEQVVINLIQNAYQSLGTPSQGITITTGHDRKNNMVMVQVKDQGTGIAKKNLKRIQDPFFTTKRDTGGTGLGLSISAGIMEEHGGRLDFTSQPGTGTTAIALFPVPDEAA